jgi:hypothetical protein
MRPSHDGDGYFGGTDLQVPRMEEGAADFRRSAVQKLANTIFSLSLFVNLCAQAGTSLLMHR